MCMNPEYRYPDIGYPRRPDGRNRVTRPLFLWRRADLLPALCPLQLCLLRGRGLPLDTRQTLENCDESTIMMGPANDSNKNKKKLWDGEKPSAKPDHSQLQVGVAVEPRTFWVVDWRTRDDQVYDVFYIRRCVCNVKVPHWTGTFEVRASLCRRWWGGGGGGRSKQRAVRSIRA